MTAGLDLARCAVVLPAAGSGQRAGAGRNKLLVPLRGEPLLLHTLRAVAAVGAGQVVLVCRDDERATMAGLAAAAGLAVTWATGGATRAESVANGLAALAPEIELVAVHDAARPLVEPALFWATLADAAATGSGIAALPIADTLRRRGADGGATTVDREGVWAMQTPQAARVALLRAAQVAAGGALATDEAGWLEAAGADLTFTLGSARNIKVTRPEDFSLAEMMLSDRTPLTPPPGLPRVGYGYDVHRLVPGRELWLGGVRLEHELGLLGHSDADSLLHAICDALLGAVGAGDIGRHFPDTDPKYKGAASVDLLAAVGGLLEDAGWQVGNIDATVVAQRPKLAPHIPAMRGVIAQTLGLAEDQVNLKATTNEELDDIGAEQGIAAHAVALVVRRADRGE